MFPFHVHEFIDPIFAKTSPKRSFSMTENERFGLVFAKTGSINSGTGVYSNYHAIYICRLKENGRSVVHIVKAMHHCIFSSGPCVVLDERSLGNPVWWPAGHPG
jgi:hypothetical protein